MDYHYENSARKMEQNVNVEDTYKKTKIGSIHLKFDDVIDYKKFFDSINKYFNFYDRYSVIVRVSYTKNDSINEWKSLGSQIGLYRDKNSGELSLTDLYETIINRLKISQEIYDYKDDEINSFQILILNIKYTKIVKEKLRKFDPKSLGDSKDLINVSNTTEMFNYMLPLTNNINYFGDKLSQYKIDDKVVGYIDFKGSCINFMDLVNKYIVDRKNCIENFGDNTIFISRVVNGKSYILIIKMYDYINNISIYTTNGIFVTNITDKKLTDQKFSRSINNVKVIIDNTGITKKLIKVNLKPVYPKKPKGRLSDLKHIDKMIGTFDLETYDTSNNISKVYAAGFYTENYGVKTFYINKDLDSNDLLVRCLNSLLTDKYNGYSFYVHNFGEFDGCYLLPVIIRLKSLDSSYDYKLDFKDNKILYMIIRRKIGTKTYTIKLQDSLLMLNASLDKLSKTFDTTVKKGYFPYKFVKQSTIFYNGLKPSIEYYNNINQIDYNMIPETDWCVETECIKYLTDDLLSLYQVVNKFKYQIFLDYNTHITNCLTISGLAMNIYLNKFYSNNIPLIDKKSLYNDIKNSYYGGMTEVYRPYGENLYYYDVNSLYPYSALQPMPGLNCIYIDDINKDISDCNINKIFGFFYCTIDAPDSYIGFLPVRDQDQITMPTGVWKGWYFSEELLFASKQGCKIKVHYGYQFDKVNDVFKDYVEHFYNIKSTTKSSVEKMIAKSLLNNLIGRFGLNIDRCITRLISEEEYMELLQYKEIYNVNFIEGRVLVTHSKEVSKEICEKHNVDYQEAIINDAKFSDSKNRVSTQFNSVSIAIASAVTSYSRIFMNKIKLDILNKNGFIYYTDTDSIVTNVKLDSNIVGNKIGQFKLVDTIKEGYFISNKTYGYINQDNKVCLTVKGLNEKNLSLNPDTSNPLFNYNDLKKMYKGNNIDTVRKVSMKKYSLGSVSIIDKSPVNLQPNAYNKRVKVFDNNKLWVNTTPLKRNYNTIVYKYNSNSILLYIYIGFLSIIVLILSYMLYTTYIQVQDLLNLDVTTAPTPKKVYIHLKDQSLPHPNINSCPGGFADRYKNLCSYYSSIVNNAQGTKPSCFDYMYKCKYNGDFSNINIDLMNYKNNTGTYKPNYINFNIDERSNILKEIRLKNKEYTLAELSKTKDELNYVKYCLTCYENVVNDYYTKNQKILQDMSTCTKQMNDIVNKTP